MAIAGLDPSGGAGVLADIKTINALGCYGLGVVTSITYQNTQGVSGARHLEPAEVIAQINPLFDDFDVTAIKTGMLPTADVVRAIADRLGEAKYKYLVVDPVAVSSSGHLLADSAALEAAKTLLFPIATIITPNCREAKALTGIDATDVESMEAAAKAIVATGASAALVTGGDLEGKKAIDVLVHKGGTQVYSLKRFEGQARHGTGCTLASAVSCLLADGLTMEHAVETAKQYVWEAISNAPSVGKGHPPLRHFTRTPHS